jgi:protein SCO1/2
MKKRKKSSLAGFTLVFLTSLLLGNCQSPPKSYVLTGRVVSKQPATGQMVIDNDNIPGFMPAMIMPYTVKDPDGMAKVQPADMVRADVIVSSKNEFWLEHVAVIGKSAARTSPDAASFPVLMIGDKIPDVPFVNQDGKTLRLNQFKGKAVLLTFVYTRCPFPDYCPLISSRFAEIQRELAKNPEEYRNTHLLSLSLDPDYDKPPILRAYGLPYLDRDPKGFQHWDFGSTTSADLQKLLTSFGIDYGRQDGQISHSLNTILVAPDGTVAQMWPGNEWQTSEVVSVMRQSLAVQNKRP